MMGLTDIGYRAKWKVIELIIINRTSLSRLCEVLGPTAKSHLVKNFFE